MRNSDNEEKSGTADHATKPTGRRIGQKMAKTPTGDCTGEVIRRGAARPSQRSKTGFTFEVAFEPDAALAAAAEAALGPPPDLSRGHYVIEHRVLRAEIGDEADGSDENLSSEEAARVARLRKLAADPDTLYRPHLVADADLILRLERVREMAPNGGEALDIVIGAAHVSALTGAPLDVPPLLLVGPSGCGKTRLVREIGRALGVPVLTLLGSTMADASPVLGSGVGWKGAGSGRLAEVLLRAPTSAPVVFVDEIEKMRLWDRREQASDILLGLLDRDMAAAHEDLYLRVPMRAERIVWILAANTAEGLSAALRDRSIMVGMQPPSRDERRAIVERVHAETRARLRLDRSAMLEAALIDLLEAVSLRRLGPALQLALGRAVGAGRDRLERDDLAWAASIVDHGREPVRRPVGFVWPGE